MASLISKMSSSPRTNARTACCELFSLALAMHITWGNGGGKKATDTISTDDEATSQGVDASLGVFLVNI